MEKTSLFLLPEISPFDPIEYTMFWELWLAERFFECHEVLEELWKRTRGRERWFYNGLIHGAVAIYQHRRGNSNGAYRQLLRAQVKLLPFAPRHRNLEIAAFLQSVEGEIAPSLAQIGDEQRARWPLLQLSIENRMARDFE